MGISTDAHVCYGVIISNDQEVPWEWGLDECWPEGQECPFELINACCSEEPVWIIAIKETVQTVYRGCPKPLKRIQMAKDPEFWNDLLFDFVKEHKIRVTSPPDWLLASEMS